MKGPLYSCLLIAHLPSEVGCLFGYTILVYGQFPILCCSIIINPELPSFFVVLFLSTIVFNHRVIFPVTQQVHFLHEDVIVESIQKAAEERLLSCNASRTYFTQALLPGATAPVTASSLQLQEDSGTKKNAGSCEQCSFTCTKLVASHPVLLLSATCKTNSM